MSTYEAGERAKPGFGDVCSAEFLHDVVVRQDSRALRREAQIANAFWRKRVPDVPDEFPAFLATGESRVGEDYVLAHGAPHDAVVLSDDCVVESALGRDGTGPRGRVLMAPVTRPDEHELEAHERAPSLGTCVLPADERLGEVQLVHLRRCFMVRAGDFADGLSAGMVTYRLTDAYRRRLAVQWTAYAARRGPLIAQDNARKLAELIAQQTGWPIERAGATALAVGAPVIASWVFEGAALERAGATWDARRSGAGGKNPGDDGSELRDFPKVVTELREQLTELHQRTRAALDALGELGF